jgi:alkylation response protein AidB-like acyl-CoA dehydrogenase
VGARVRHGAAADTCAVPQPQWGLALAGLGERRPERTLDGSGTLVAEIGVGEPLEDASARWDAWTAATVGYLAGLAAAALDAAVAHARAREQFGQPLAAIPAVQARLADAALAVEALEVMAWRAAVPREAGGETGREPALLWAGAACREVTSSAHQVHGAVGFALESGLHRYYRRAKAVQVWAAAVCRAATTALPRTPAARGGGP